MTPAPATIARPAALIDAALTVQGWQRQGPYTGYTADRIRRHVSRSLKCYPAWPAIEAAIVQRLMGEAP